MIRASNWRMSWLCINDAVRAEPQNAVVYMARARAYDDAEKSPAAIADFSKAIELNPKLLAAYLVRAIVYEKAKELSGRYRGLFQER